MTALLILGFWSQVVLQNFRVQARVDGIRGELVMLVLFVPTVWLWAMLGAAL